MPRKEGQKLKLLTLLEIFVRETDEKHPISVPRMVELLKAVSYTHLTLPTNSTV